MGESFQADVIDGKLQVCLKAGGDSFDFQYGNEFDLSELAVGELGEDKTAIRWSDGDMYYIRNKDG